MFVADGKKIVAMHSNEFTEPTEWEKDFEIKQENSGFSSDFCPTQVSSGLRTYKSTEHTISVLNDCSGGAQAVITYKLDEKDSKHFEFKSYSAPPTRLDIAFICPTSDGFFVGSENLHTTGTVLKINNKDDLFVQKVPQKILGDTEHGDTFFHSCLPRSNLVVYRRDADQLLTATVINGEAGQESRYRSEFTLEASHAYSYETKFGILTWFSQDDKSAYRLTLHTPEFEVTTKTVTKEIKDERVSFNFENGEGEFHYHLDFLATIKK